MKFGDRLRQIRKQRGLTQEELAKLLDTSKQVISRYENGQRSPKITTVNEYAKMLGLSLDYMLGEDKLPIPGAIPYVRGRLLPVLGSGPSENPLFKPF